MRWKNPKKTLHILWMSFLCVLFIVSLMDVVKAYALPDNNENSPKPLTDQQLMALMSKADQAKISSSPPKMNGKDIFLQSFTSSSVNNSSLTSTNNSSSQRCLYNNQEYVLGDMVKSDAGWIRCTSSIFFTSDNPTTSQPGQSIWIKVQ